MRATRKPILASCLYDRKYLEDSIKRENGMDEVKVEKDLRLGRKKKKLTRRTSRSIHGKVVYFFVPINYIMDYVKPFILKKERNKGSA